MCLGSVVLLLRSSDEDVGLRDALASELLEVECLSVCPAIALSRHVVCLQTLRHETDLLVAKDLIVTLTVFVCVWPVLHRSAHRVCVAVALPQRGASGLLETGAMRACFPVPLTPPFRQAARATIEVYVGVPEKDVNVFAQALLATLSS